MKQSLPGMFCALAVMLGVVLACSTDNKSSQSGNSNAATTANSSSSPQANTNASPPIKVTSVALATEYEDNEVAADQKYEGKTLEVTGKVQSVDKVLGSVSATLAGKTMSIVSVQCFFENEADVLALKKGQTATLRGTGNGKSLNVELQNCAVVK